MINQRENKKRNKPFFRFCRNNGCNNKFKPIGKWSYYCDDCRYQLRNKPHKERIANAKRKRI